MIKIKDKHIAKLLDQIENDRDVLKELNIQVELNILHEAITLTKEEVDFNDCLTTEYVFSAGNLTKIVSFNNKLFKSRKLGVYYDDFININKTKYCDPSFSIIGDDDIINLYNKVIEANKTLKSLDGF